jgi:hypothetical protein
MNNRFSLKKNLFNAVNLSKSFDKSEVIIINLEVDINTTEESIKGITKVLINGLSKCTRKTKIYFVIQYLELNGIDPENLSLNYKFILCGEKFKLNITNHQVKNVLTQVIHDDSFGEYQIKEVSKEELVVELVPIHLGITNSNVIKKLPQHLFNKMMSDITVISGNQLENNLNQYGVKFAGNHV